MTNDNRDNRKDQEGREQNQARNPAQDTFPGNPNRQDQISPGQQQGGGRVGKKSDQHKLHEDRSVTDRTVRRSVIDRDDEADDGDIDRLKG